LTSLDNFLTIVDVYLIQGSSLIGFDALVTAHGGDSAALLDLAGIDPADVTASLRCATPSPRSKVPCYTVEGVPYYTPPGQPC